MRTDVRAAAMGACAPQADRAQPPQDAAAVSDRHPESGLQIIPLTIDTGDAVHTFRVEIAATPEDQSRGLMFRTELGPDEGMLFPSEPPQARSFWMKNTPLPLDIIFIGTDGRVINIARETTPYSTDSVASEGTTSAVLELIGGRAAELGIEPGDAVRYELP